MLEWLLFLNTHDEVTYRTAHGDKDTFRAAFHLAGRAAMYQQVRRPCMTAGDYDTARVYCSGCTAQGLLLMTTVTLCLQVAHYLPRLGPTLGSRSGGTTHVCPCSSHGRHQAS